VYAQITSTTVYDPVSSCVSPTKPSITITNNTISWNALNDATGYIVYRDGKYIGSTTATSFTDASGIGAYSVRALNSIGVLSDAATIATALTDVPMDNVGITANNQTITLSHSVEKMQLVTTTGSIIAQNTNESKLALNNLSQGVYILKIHDKGLTFTKKIILGTE